MEKWKSMATPNDDGPNEGRRKFLKFLGVAAVGGALGFAGNKYLEREKDINQLLEHFSKKDYVGDFSAVCEASDLLIKEMEADNYQKVLLSGNDNPPARIEILRDFITKHLGSKSGEKYAIKDRILSNGFYSKEDLLEIKKRATFLKTGKSEMPEDGQ